MLHQQDVLERLHFLKEELSDILRRKHPGSHMCDISLSVLLMANSGPDSQERVPADSRETTRSLLLTSRRPTVSPPQSATRHPSALPKLKSSLAPSCHYRSRVDAGKPFAFFCQPVFSPLSLLIVTSKEGRTGSSNAHLSARPNAKIDVLARSAHFRN